MDFKIANDSLQRVLRAARHPNTVNGLLRCFYMCSLAHVWTARYAYLNAWPDDRMCVPVQQQWWLHCFVSSCLVRSKWRKGSRHVPQTAADKKKRENKKKQKDTKFSDLVSKSGTELSNRRFCRNANKTSGLAIVSVLLISTTHYKLHVSAPGFSQISAFLIHQSRSVYILLARPKMLLYVCRTTTSSATP